MTEPAFTPGSWLIHARHRWIVPAEDAFKEAVDALPICQLRDPDERLTEDETLANGFLIAAAPDLYAALETCLAALNPHIVHSISAGIARECAEAALAKARGDA
jgi:hypothetical protein